MQSSDPRIYNDICNRMLGVLGQNPTIHIYVFNEDSQHSIPCLNVPCTSYTYINKDFAGICLLNHPLFSVCYSVFVFCTSSLGSTNPLAKLTEMDYL